MNIEFDHRDPGTPESEWRTWLSDTDLAEIDLDIDRLIVVVAHPDDETLGAAGLMARCTTSGIAVQVVIATDGAAVEGGGPDTGRTRRRESVEALDDVAPGAALTFLGLPDGAVSEHRTAFASEMRRLLRTAHRTLVVTTAPGDAHPDHAAVGEVVRAVAPPHVPVLAAPIWLWHWADPGAVDPDGWTKLTLSAEERSAKRRSIGRHRTQLSAIGPVDAAPIIHSGMRAHFERDVEIFVPVEQTDVSAGPNTDTESVGTAHFDDLFARDPDPWGFHTRWYERRKRDLLLAALPDARFDAALEVGCAIGVLSHALAARCTSVLGVDASRTAVARARASTTGADGLRFACCRVPDEWPDGSFDLIVLSEVMYYLGAADRAEVHQRVRDSLRPRGVVAVCHWRHDLADAPSSGDAVHAELADGLGLPRILRLVEDDFVLEMYGHRPSPAQAEGLV